jgi:predicted transcriptional regulator
MPQLSRRALAKDLGVALGSFNFSLQGLVEKGWINMQKFSHSKNRLIYAYLLTPAKLAEKSKFTAV